MHASVSAISRRGKIGIIGATAILRIGKHEIVAISAAAPIIGLEITGCFIKAILISNVVYNVVPVKQIGNVKSLIGGRRNLSWCSRKIRRKF